MGFLDKILKKDSSLEQPELPPAPNIDNSMDVPPPPDFNFEADGLDLGDSQEIPQEEELPEPMVDIAPVGNTQSITSESAFAEGPIESEFDTTVEEEHEEIARKREEIIKSNKPLFAKVDDYRSILGAADEVRHSLKECDDVLKRLNEIKLEEDKEYEKWKNMMVDIYRKIHSVDKLFFDQL